VSLDCPWDTIQVHIRGGSIITSQAPQMSVDATWTQPLTLIAAPDKNGNAYVLTFLPFLLHAMNDHLYVHVA
jgi:alpha-glucosidase (family GH31 glycosyl hydrolase)